MSSRKLRKRKETPVRNLKTFREIDVETQFYLGDTLIQGDVKYEGDCDPDLENAMIIGRRLQNMLQHQYSYKWILYEFFYSLTDVQLLCKPNQFQMLLEKSMPHLKTRNLTIIEWQKIRSILGKPKRFSQNFINAKRSDLKDKREVIQYAQLSKFKNENSVPMALDPPHEIPHILPINEEVSALLCSPWVGIYDGIVTGFDFKTFMYKIKFHRDEIGSQLIADINLMWKKTYGTFSIDDSNSNFQVEFIKATEFKDKTNGINTNISGAVVKRSPSPAALERDYINGHPIKLLQAIVLLKKAVASKQEIVDKVSEMNDEAENIYPKSGQKSSADSRNSRAYPAELSSEFKECYTSLIGSLKKLNNSIQEYTNEIISYNEELKPPPEEKKSADIASIREKCRTTAAAAVRHNNKGLVQDENIVALIEKFSTALLAASVPCTDENAKAVEEMMVECIEDTKSSISKANIVEFDKLIRTPLMTLRHENNK